MSSHPQDEQQRNATSGASSLFQPTPREARLALAPILLASLAVLLLATVFVLVGHRGNAGGPKNSVENMAYADKVVFSGLVMSESTSLSGGKSTFIDGQVGNQGDQTVTALQVQVLFANDEAMPPQTVTLPVTLIRSREPYIDTEPMSAEPLAPGKGKDFRLIFENIGANWNQQIPEIRVVKVFTLCTTCR